MEKICSKCGINKNLEMFAKANRYKDGRRSYCKKCHSEYMSTYYKQNPEKLLSEAKIKSAKNRKNWKRHKMLEEDYNSLFNLYKGKCHSCKDRNATNIDHDHSCCPGLFSCGSCVRGILCNQCNTALGLLGDSTEKIKSLLKYSQF